MGAITVVVKRTASIALRRFSAACADWTYGVNAIDKDVNNCRKDWRVEGYQGTPIVVKVKTVTSTLSTKDNRNSTITISDLFSLGRELVGTSDYGACPLL